MYYQNQISDLLQLNMELLQYNILTIAFTITFISQVHLIFKASKFNQNDRLSSIIIIHMVFWCIASVTGGFYMGYMGLSSSKNSELIDCFKIILTFYKLNIFIVFKKNSFYL